jgi:hypothetical protein
MGNPNDQKQGQGGGRERDPRDPQQKPMKEGQGGQPDRERQREPNPDRYPDDEQQQPERR